MSGSGIGLGTLLGIVFLVLKLCGVIAWPWLWVLAPFWIPFAFIGALFLGAVFVGALALLVSK